MKLLFSLAMAWALSLAVNAATVSFSGITSTNAVKTNDLLLVDSALGGTNYATRTATIATLQSALSIPAVPTGLVSNSVAQSGLLAVDATKTNGVAATAAMVNAALNFTAAPIAAQVSLTHAGTVTLTNSDYFTEANLTLTGAVTFATANLASGRSYTVYGLNNQATNCQPTFPTNGGTNAWHWMGGAPQTFPAGYAFILSITARGTSDTNVWAACSIEQ